MEGKIDKYGNLYIKRGSIMKIMECPHRIRESEESGDSIEYTAKACSDNCPLFDEPYEPEGFHTCTDCDSKRIDYKHTQIDICHNKELYFDKFIDERE